MSRDHSPTHTPEDTELLCVGWWGVCTCVPVCARVCTRVCEYRGSVSVTDVYLRLDGAD